MAETTRNTQGAGSAAGAPAAEPGQGTGAGWTSAHLEARRGDWSLPLGDGDRRLLWEDATAGRWDAADGVRARLRAFIEGSLDAVGFAHVANLMDPAAPDTELVDAFSFFLRELGEIIPQNAAGDLTQVLRDREGDGATELGFHADTCDLLVLLCLQPAADGGGFTKLASAGRVHDIVAHERPDALALLKEHWRFDRTGRAGQQIIHSPILFTQDDGTVGCYYQTRTVRASAQLDEPHLAALDHLDDVLYRPEIAFRLRLGAGDLLVIRNSRVLHGRSPYVDEPGPRSRRVLRVWMNTP
ncbi:TauD/TfdA family dioxygenase [Streptomyces sp. NPDC050560]|uniref:TauD/TfdA family dioxygenase n=1 Tax=Streptomyces sp. NPDC050560 TaxID=3365630 RepID=UPI0037A7A35B